LILSSFLYFEDKGVRLLICTQPCWVGQPFVVAHLLSLYRIRPDSMNLFSFIPSMLFALHPKRSWLIMPPICLENTFHFYSLLVFSLIRMEISIILIFNDDGARLEVDLSVGGYHLSVSFQGEMFFYLDMMLCTI